jgi:DNA-binding NarL/FixJ family response regulator
MGHAVQPDADRNLWSGSEATPEGGPSAGPAHPHVLVVEDQPNLRLCYRRVLEGAGYRLFEAATLTDAAYAIGRPDLQFDAALVDLALPDGHGAALIRPLMHRRPLCRAAVITGGSATGHPLGIAQIGADSYLKKPVEPSEILKAVQAAVRSTIEWRATVESSDRGDTERSVEAPDGGDPRERVAPIDLARAVGRLREIGALSPTQALVAGRILWGDSDREISEFLGCSLRTANNHVHETLRKLSVRRRTGLLRVLLEDAGEHDPKPA